MTSQLTEEEEKAKNLGKVKNKQEMMMVDLEGKSLTVETGNLDAVNDVHVCVFFPFSFRASEERGENAAGAGEGQAQTGRRVQRPPGPDRRASGSDRGAEDAAGQKGGGATGRTRQVGLRREEIKRESQKCTLKGTQQDSWRLSAQIFKRGGATIQS